MIFSQIFGQDDLVAKLKKMVSENRIPHAILFSEQPGGGALPLVLALVQFIFCKTRRALQMGDNTWELKGLFGDSEEAIPHDDSCEVCSSCIKIRNLQHPDFYYIFPINTTPLVEKGKKANIDAYYDIFRKLIVSNPYFSETELYKAMGLENKMGLIGVSEANWIIERLSFTAFEGGSRVVLIMFPERMNLEAANKLLKSIEEPSNDTYFFLITNAPGKIIQTIRSRCRLIEVPPIETEALAKDLEQKFKLSKEEANIWARISRGSMGKAISMIDESDEDKEDFSDLCNLFTMACQAQLPKMLELGTAIASKGKEEQKRFCLTALKVLREVYIKKIKVSNIEYFSPNKEQEIERLSQLLPADFISVGYKIFNFAIESVESNVNAKILFTDICNQIFVYIQKMDR